MDIRIETPKMSEILIEEFMQPLGLSAYRLAREIKVPVSRVQDILHDRRKITADTSLRLARFFGVSDKYFLDIQNDIDLRELKITLADDIQSIKPYQQMVM
jgi:addiction module HigA family antidote